MLEGKIVQSFVKRGFALCDGVNVSDADLLSPVDLEGMQRQCIEKYARCRKQTQAGVM